MIFRPHPSTTTLRPQSTIYNPVRERDCVEKPMKPAALILATLVAIPLSLASRASYGGQAAAAQTLPTSSPTPAKGPSPADLQRITTKLGELSDRITALGAKRIDPALLADADVYRKAAERKSRSAATALPHPTTCPC